MLPNNSMGTETKVNSYSENTASGITRAPKVSDNSNARIDNICPNNGKQSSCITQPSTSSSNVPFVPVQIDENDVIGGAQKIIAIIRPHWNLNFIEYKVM